MEAILKELETAAQILLADPNVVTMETRHAAEAVFMNFRQSKQPYMMCKQILDTSRVDYVLFEAAGLLKTALIREWSFLEDSDKKALKEYLLNYVIEQRPTLAAFVRERILQVIAIVVKRESVEDLGLHSRRQLLDQIENLILNGDFARQTLGCSLLAALLQEYAITVKSSDVGLTWETHFLAKKMFELTDLKRIFQFCSRALGSLVMSENSFSQQTTGLLKSLQSLLETILTWRFISPCFPKRMVARLEVLGETEQQPSLCLPSNWSDVVKDPQLINLFFTVYWKIRMNPQLAHHGMTCIVQLATLNGSSFENEENRVQYINIFLQAFVHLLSNVEVLDREALGISNIIHKILIYFPPGILDKLPQELMQSFLNHFTKLTCNFAEGAAGEESMCADDQLYLEGFDRLMDAWLLLLMGSLVVPETVQKDISRQILDVYLKCHLAPPAGTRGTGRELEAEELEEQDEIDRLRYSDQLEALGSMARIVPEYSLPLISDLLEARINRLKSVLESFRCQPLTIADNSALVVLFEDLHWLLLIAGNILTMHGEGETQTIPSELVRFSVKISQTVNKDISLQIFGSPQQDSSAFGEKTQADPILRLVAAVFRLAYLVNDGLRSNMVQLLSPEVSSSILWFLRKWSAVYLLLDEELYSEISLVILAAHGRDSDGAIWALNFLFSQANSHLQYFNSEPAVCAEAVQLLMTLVKNNYKRNCFIQSPSLSTLHSLLPQLPSTLKRGIYSSLTLAGGALDSNREHKYWVQIFRELQGRFNTVAAKGIAERMDDSVKGELIDLLECCTGSVEGSESSTVQIIFYYLHPILTEVPNLLNVYHNYQNIVENALTFLCETSRTVVIYLKRSEIQLFFDICIRSIEAYAKWNRDRLSLETDALDDTFQDVLLLIEILTNLLRKDFFDFAPDDTEVSNDMPNYTAADVCLCGLNIIMPLMSLDLLKYPPLCLGYFKFLEFVSDNFPEKILQLPQDLLKNVLTSIELGLTTFGQEVIVYCCSFLQFVATHVAHLRGLGEQSNPVLKPFLKILMTLILSHQINKDNMESASQALFSLICCYDEEYKAVVSELLSQQANPAIAERLTKAFNYLMLNVKLTTERVNRLKFRNNFDKFIVDVHGFLLVK